MEVLRASPGAGERTRLGCREPPGEPARAREQGRHACEVCPPEGRTHTKGGGWDDSASSTQGDAAGGGSSSSSSSSSSASPRGPEESLDRTWVHEAGGAAAAIEGGAIFWVDGGPAARLTSCGKDEVWLRGEQRQAGTSRRGGEQPGSAGLPAAPPRLAQGSGNDADAIDGMVETVTLAGNGFQDGENRPSGVIAAAAPSQLAKSPPVSPQRMGPGRAAGPAPVAAGGDGEDEAPERRAEREAWTQKRREVAERHRRDREMFRRKNMYEGTDPNSYGFDPLRGRNGPVSTRGGVSTSTGFIEFFVPRGEIARDLCTAWVLSLAHSSSNRYGMLGAEASEELPRVRMYVTQTTTPVLLIEFNSPRTFNMMDTIFVSDLNCVWDAFAKFKETRMKRQPLSYFLQGAGAHFCPGGNPNAIPDPGTTPFQMHQYNISLPFLRFRELAMPGTCAMHGSAVGGGVAISLNTTFRFAVQNLSVSFGNLSRGAVPCMDLSKNLNRRMGLASAMGLYLTDATVSAKGANDATIVKEICRTVSDTKTKAFVLASRVVESSHFMTLHRTTVSAINTTRYTQEGYAMSFAARTGEQFGNVGAKVGKARLADRPASDQAGGAPETGSPWGAGEAQYQDQAYGAPTACAYCSTVTSEGWWGWGEFAGQFYCSACWRKVPALAKLEANRIGDAGTGTGSASRDEEYMQYLNQYSDALE